MEGVSRKGRLYSVDIVDVAEEMANGQYKETRQDFAHEMEGS